MSEFVDWTNPEEWLNNQDHDSKVPDQKRMVGAFLLFEQTIKFYTFVE